MPSPPHRQVQLPTTTLITEAGVDSLPLEFLGLPETNVDKPQFCAAEF